MNLGSVSGQPNTTRDASADIHKVSMHLLENGVTPPQTSRTSPPFRDITEDGFSKISQTWLQQVLTPVPDMEDASNNEQQTLHRNMADFDYELHHVS